MDGQKATKIDPTYTFGIHNGYLTKVPNKKPGEGCKLDGVIVASQKTKDLILSQKIKIGA
jgi:hypothetical protein